MFLPKAGLIVGNRYSLTQPIGRGGMGEVWKAHDRELDTPCAVKFILQHLAADRGIRERFAREAKAVARLRSPHVVHILGVGEVEEVPYLAMELLDGETLLARLDRLGKLDPTVVMKVVDQVGEALESAHEAGIVHRDLKPENIWFWSGNKVFAKVLDFGVAKTGLATGSLQTATGALVGTPQYMSPEQALGNRDVDHRSDLWSLAVITIECLCGKRPFESDGLGDLLIKIVSNKPPSLHDLAPDLPLGLHEWWTRALARDPRDRFQSASELADALRPHLVGNGPYSTDAYSARPAAYNPPQDSRQDPRHDPLYDAPFSEEQRSRGSAPQPLTTDAGGVVISERHSVPESRPPFATEVQPHSGQRHSEQRHSEQRHSEQPHSAQPHSGQPRSGQPHSAQVRPQSSQPRSSSPSTAVGVVSERAQRPSPGSVGPISSSRRPAARTDNRQRTVVLAAALVTIGVVGTFWRMLSSDDGRPSAQPRPPVASADPALIPTPAGPNAPVGPAVTPPARTEVRSPPTDNPWDGALGTKPRETRTTTEALLPRATPTPPQAMLAQPAPPQAILAQPGDSPPATSQPASQPAAKAGTPPRATPPRGTPPRATPPRATPPRATAVPPPRAPTPAAPARPPAAPSASAASLGLSAPPAKANPAQSGAKSGDRSGPGGSADPGRSDAEAKSDEERKAKLKRRIGLGSK
ncbi:MAG: hypothetical protein RL033_4464 [Pseudomonadota bacterium]